MLHHIMLQLLVLMLLIQAPQTTGRTVIDGVYSEAQAARGKGLYGSHCEFCHGDALQGVHAPRLVGERFIDQWRESPLAGIYNFIRRNMPPKEEVPPRPITENDYLDIMTHILKANGYPAGPNDLMADAVENILVVGKDGRQPAPSGAHVVSVGCLTEGRPDQWLLVNATEPERVSTSVSTAQELRAAAERPLGELTFRIADREALPRFSPSTHKGHKMQVKGTLFRQVNADRISVTSVEMVDSNCQPNR
jgi:hypothetical protein